MKIRTLFLLMVTLLTTVAFANGNPQKVKQTGIGTIIGSVYESTTGNPVEYATITIQSIKDSSIISGGITDDKGLFNIENIPGGEYFVRCSFIGYEQKFLKNILLSPEKNSVDLGKINITPKEISKGEVEVVAEKDAVTYELDKKVVNVSANPEAQSGTAADALKNVPSVFVDIDGNVTLRGSANFTLLIDGKPTMMNANDVFRQLPASIIDKIEIITNPSAKYDPEGTSGIINIIMKKEAAGQKGMSGFSGIINSTIGTRDKYSGDCLINYKNSKYSTYLSIDGNTRSYHPKSDFIRQTFSNDSIFYISSNIQRLMIPYGYSGNFGLDYNLNEFNSVSISANLGYFGFDRFFPTKFTGWINDNKNDSYFQFNDDDFILGGSYYNTNLNYKKNFDAKGHEINTNIIFAGWDGKFSELSKMFDAEKGFDEAKEILEQHNSDLNNNKTNIRLKLDYVLPISEKSKFEAGFDANYLWTESSYLYEDMDIPNGKWIKNILYSNDYNFSQAIQAIYTTYGFELFSISSLIGLRTEYYDRVFKQLTQKEEYGLNQFNFFPSLHLSRQFEGDHQLQFSFSKRVQRPDDRTLNPFPDYVDKYYKSGGNPYLKPEFTDSYEINYRKGFGASFLSLETYYRNTKDMFARTMTLLDDGKIFITIGNINDSKYLGSELSAQIVPLKWLRLNFSANYFNYSFTEMINSEKVERNQNVTDGNLRLTFIPLPTTFVVLSTYYQGEKIIPNSGVMDEVFTFSFALRQDLFNRSLTLTLSGKDVFSTAKYRFNNTMPNFISFGTMYPEHPYFDLTISYKINNYKPEQRKDEQLDIKYDSGF